jgi:hypothetical protein
MPNTALERDAAQAIEDQAGVFTPIKPRAAKRG